MTDDELEVCAVAAENWIPHTPTTHFYCRKECRVEDG